MAEAKHDVLSWDALFHQRIHHFTLGDVAVQPNLAVFDDKMKDHGEYIVVALPSSLQQLELIAIPVCNDIAVNIGHVRRFDFGVFPKVIG